jgi:hypothetical protein
LIHVLSRYVPVQSSLLAHLDIRDIISLSQTTKRLSGLYDTTIQSRGNINRALEHYFSSPKEFRNLQARTDALLAWDFAYNFFARRSPSHLTAEFDIFVEMGKSEDMK